MEDTKHGLASGDCRAKSLKQNLEGWREFVVLASKLTRWEQPYYPFIVFSLITFKFLLVWYLDPSFITGVSMFLLVLLVLDYSVPFLTQLIFSPADWNGKKQKEFSRACESLADSANTVHDLLTSLFELKHTNSWVYVSFLTVILSTLSWLGNLMHNLMLLYFVVIVVTALPGLCAHGVMKMVGDKVKKFKGKKNN